MIGSQQPRLSWVPDYDSSLGDEAVELAGSCGLILDEWQQLVLRHSLGMRGDKFAAFEVGLCVPRQNGKGGVLEARELAGLFLLGERTIVHSAHEFNTASTAMARMEQLLDQGGLLAQVKRGRAMTAHGHEGFHLKDGRQLHYQTRTKSRGRGLTGDCVMLDEAMYLPARVMAALMPLMRAKSEEGNPQMWYTGSAVDQLSMDDGLIFTLLREKGLAGEAGRMLWLEWSAPFDHPEQVPESDLMNRAHWFTANPALGIRISPEHMQTEMESAMPLREKLVELWNVGDWPDPEQRDATVIDLQLWDELFDEQSALSGAPVFAFDVTPARSAGAIGVAGRRDDELVHLEVVDHQPGTGWIVPRMLDLHEKHRPAAVVCTGAGPAFSLVEELEEKGVQVKTLTAQQEASACGRFYDLVAERRVRHRGDPRLVTAIRGAEQRTLAEAWAWGRRKSKGVDISPLVAVTFACDEALRAVAADFAIAFA